MGQTKLEVAKTKKLVERWTQWSWWRRSLPKEKLSQNFSWAVWLNPTDCLSVSIDRRGS